MCLPDFQAVDNQILTIILESSQGMVAVPGVALEDIFFTQSCLIDKSKFDIISSNDPSKVVL